MSKIVSLTLNNDFGVLKAQQVEFVESDGLIEVKAAVGSGKSTLKQASELVISAGNTQIVPFDDKKFKEVDVEMKLTYSDTPIYMRTRNSKSGALVSTVYVKDENGKASSDPVINGKKMTPAVMRDAIRTDLTFGIDNFLSENTRTHMAFMMNIYAYKLKKLGVIFDVKSPDYQNSILWRLDQAKMDRQNKHIIRRGCNGFKEALLEEGWDELNVPALVDIKLLEAQIKENEAANARNKEVFINNWYNEKAADLSKIQARIDELSAEANKYISQLKSFNDNAEITLKNDINEFNQLQAELKYKRDKIEEVIITLAKYGYPDYTSIEKWFLTVPTALPERIFETEKTLIKFIPFTADGKLDAMAFEMEWDAKIRTILVQIQTLRSQALPLTKEKTALEQKQIPEWTTDLTAIEAIKNQIATATASNKIAERWSAFYDWQAADDTVKNIWAEYCKLFTQIDLGVPGLSINVIGDEENYEIRTMYNGQHNPEFFGNTALQPRLLTQYSATQRPVIAILMQVYLLEQKLKNNEDGLRMIWIECPIDNKTRDLLIDIKNKYNITIIVGVTGDFTAAGLEPGHFLIEGGELLTLKTE